MTQKIDPLNNIFKPSSAAVNSILQISYIEAPITPFKPIHMASISLSHLSTCITCSAHQNQNVKFRKAFVEMALQY